MHLLLKDPFFLEQVDQSISKEESATMTVRQEFKEDKVLATQMTYVPQTPFFEVFYPTTNQAHLA